MAQMSHRQIYGKDYGGKNEKTSKGLIPYEPKIKKYWNAEKALGIIEFNGKFVGLACLWLKRLLIKRAS